MRLDKNHPRIGKAATTCEYFFAWIEETFGSEGWTLLWAPLLRLVRGIRPRRNGPNKSPRRIGLVKPAALGDTVLLSALAEDLRMAFPKVRVILFSGSGDAGLARLMTG